MPSKPHPSALRHQRCNTIFKGTADRSTENRLLSLREPSSGKGYAPFLRCLSIYASSFLVSVPGKVSPWAFNCGWMWIELRMFYPRDVIREKEIWSDTLFKFTPSTLNGRNILAIKVNFVNIFVSSWLLCVRPSNSFASLWGLRAMLSVEVAVSWSWRLGFLILFLSAEWLASLSAGFVVTII